MTIEELKVKVADLEGFDAASVAHMPVADMLMAAKRAGIETNLRYDHINFMGSMANC